MGATSADTLKEIDQARVKLEMDLAELGDHIPRPAPWMKRAVAMAFLGSIALWLAAKMRTKRS